MSWHPAALITQERPPWSERMGSQEQWFSNCVSGNREGLQGQRRNQAGMSWVFPPVSTRAQLCLLLHLRVRHKILFEKENLVFTQSCMQIFIAALFVNNPNGFNAWMDKQTMVRLYHGILLSNEKGINQGYTKQPRQISTAWRSAKTANLRRLRTVYDSIYITFSKWRNHRDEWQRADQWLPGVRVQRKISLQRGITGEFLWSVRTILYPNRGGGYSNLHMW